MNCTTAAREVELPNPPRFPYWETGPVAAIGRPSVSYGCPPALIGGVRNHRRKHQSSRALITENVVYSPSANSNNPQRALQVPGPNHQPCGPVALWPLSAVYLLHVMLRSRRDRLHPRQCPHAPCPMSSNRSLSQPMASMRTSEEATSITV